MSSPTISDPARRVRRRFRWFMVAVWAGLIFYLSTAGFGASFTAWLLNAILGLLNLHVAPETFSLLHELLRKTAHVTEYAIFSLLLFASFQGKPEFEWNARIALRSVIVAGLYSLTDEYHQTFVAGRGPSLIDSGIDTMGAACATWLLWLRELLLRALRSRTAARVEPRG